MKVRFRWPVYSWQCYDCGHTSRTLQWPWYRPHLLTPEQKMFFEYSVLETQDALNASMHSFKENRDLWYAFLKDHPVGTASMSLTDTTRFNGTTLHIPTIKNADVHDS